MFQRLILLRNAIEVHPKLIYMYISELIVEEPMNSMDFEI